MLMIRVVTYADHFIGSSPDWTIDPVWLQRVSDVVDLALARDLYVVTNMHHGACRIPSTERPGKLLTRVFRFLG